MRIVVIADEPVRQEFASINLKAHVNIEFVPAIGNINQQPDVVFYLLNEEQLERDMPKLVQMVCMVVVHAVLTTLAGLPNGFTRINAWPGFLNRNVVEVVAAPEHQGNMATVFDTMGLQYRFAPDVPGMIAARIIATIINEAYYALADNVAGKHEIDVAMRLGTNYPLGPFEWCEQIGKHHIINLLNTISVTDTRYTPCAGLL